MRPTTRPSARQTAFRAKQDIIQAERKAAAIAAATRPLAPVDRELEAAFLADYGSVPVGKFENLQNIRLRWAAADIFELIPRKTKPFAFVRKSGERIEPANLFTDGGSIPRLVSATRASLGPWGYAPAYLIHDWEFDLHHCGRLDPDKSFEDVRDTMMEALKTLMQTGVFAVDRIDFQLIRGGISSLFARNTWNRPHDACPLPPKKPE